MTGLAGMANTKSATSQTRPRNPTQSRRSLRAVSLLFALVFVIIAVCLSPAAIPPPPQWSTVAAVDKLADIRALILTAHPDDECMFFSPTIISLVAQNVHVKALCLSSGNATGIGDIRAKELASSYGMLGVNGTDVSIVNHDDLQDSMKTSWDPHVVASVLKPYLEADPADIIITFDTGGITQHPNHTPLSLGVKLLLQSLLPRPETDGPLQRSRIPRLLVLQTVPKHIKFTSVFYPLYETLVSQLRARISTAPKDGTAAYPAMAWDITLPIQGYLQALRAMMRHKSQLVWFRWLYVAFSKYMWSNRLVEVEVGR